LMVKNIGKRKKGNGKIMIGKIINDKYLTFLGLFWDVWLLHP